MPFNITSKIAAYIGGAVSLALIVAMVFMTISHKSAVRQLDKTIASLRADLKQANTDLGTCRANTTTLNNAIDEQNSAIADLYSSQQSAKAKAAQAQLTAKARAGQTQRAVTAIDRAAPPASPDKYCEAADALMKGITE
jgi:septal ring factor EnvC (AmiA/AmiB activator)